MLLIPRIHCVSLVFLLCFSVSSSDIKSGMSVLCGGDMNDKAAATFSLYDLNGDGYISKSEMVAYLTNVFKVMYCVNAATRTKFGTVTPETLAMATTEDAFDHNDVNHDNLLSFDEFQHWYSPDTTAASSASSTAESADRDQITLDEIRQLTHLPEYPIEQVFETFAEATDEEGLLQR